MTTVNVLRQSNRVHLYTDGGTLNANGDIISLGAKTWPLPHLNAAVATRGPKIFSEIFAGYISNFANSFDHLKSVVEKEFRSFFAEKNQLWQLSGEADADLFVVGISETKGPDSFCISTHPYVGEAWRIVDLPDLSLTPSNDEVAGSIKNIFPADTTADDLDPESDVLKVIEVQRSHTFARTLGKRTCLTAGFIQLTTVTESEITTKIIRRWSDKIARK